MVSFKMTEDSNKSASNFALSLNITPWKLFRWFESPHYGQLVVGSFIMTMLLFMHRVSCRVFLTKHQITQVTQPHYSPYLVPCNFWLFPKLKSPLKGKRFQTIYEIEGKYNEAADGDWENCVRFQGACFEGDWGIIFLCTMFLVSCTVFFRP